MTVPPRMPLPPRLPDSCTSSRLPLVRGYPSLPLLTLYLRACRMAVPPLACPYLQDASRAREKERLLPLLTLSIRLSAKGRAARAHFGYLRTHAEF